MDLIRNKPLDEALAILQYTPKAACEPLLKLVKSAAANAENNFNMDKNNLYVAECYVCPGPTLKRMMPRAPVSYTHLDVYKRQGPYGSRAQSNADRRQDRKTI